MNQRDAVRAHLKVQKSNLILTYSLTGISSFCAASGLQDFVGMTLRRSLTMTLLRSHSPSAGLGRRSLGSPSKWYLFSAIRPKRAKKGSVNTLLTGNSVYRSF